MITKREAEIAAESLVEVYRDEGDHLGHIVGVGETAVHVEWFGFDAPEDPEAVPASELNLTREARKVVDGYLNAESPGTAARP